MSSTIVDLRDLTVGQSEAWAVERGLPRWRGVQIFRWVHRKRIDDLDGMTDLGKELRLELAQSGEVEISRLRIDLEQVSRDGTRKLRLATRDGRFIESVLIPGHDATEAAPRSPDEPDPDAELNDDDNDDVELHADAEGQAYRGGRRPEVPPGGFPRRPKLTLCVSSQVGCALDCTFCATAKLGFGRQLTAAEIVDQVYRAETLLAALPADDPTRRAGAERITNLDFMGMGEPLHNYKNLMRALAILTDKEGRDFSRRRITVSTAGLVPGLEKLAQESLQVNLAVSLNATTDEVRDELMPINKKWNIARLLEAVKKMPLGKRQRVTFEYVLLDGINDSDADAERLGRLLRPMASKVNLIPWNAHSIGAYRRPSDARVRHFHEAVQRAGLAVYVRRSRGDDIDAACGQLAAKAPAPEAPASADGLVTLRV